MNSLPQNCFASLFFTEQCSSCRNFAKKKQSKTKTAITDKHVSVKFNHFQIEFRTTICQHHSSIMNGSQNIWLFLKIVCLTLIAWIPNNNYYPLKWIHATTEMLLIWAWIDLDLAKNIHTKKQFFFVQWNNM